MIEMVLGGGLAVLVLGVIQVSEQRRNGCSVVGLIRHAMAEMEGADSEALQAEFRRSGLTPPVRRPLTGFLY